MEARRQLIDWRMRMSAGCCGTSERKLQTKRKRRLTQNKGPTRLRCEERRDFKLQEAMPRQRLMALMVPLGPQTKTELRRVKRKRATKKKKAAPRSPGRTSVTGATRTLTTQVRLQDQASIKTLQTRWSRTSTSSQASMQSTITATQTMTKAS